MSNLMEQEVCLAREIQNILCPFETHPNVVHKYNLEKILKKRYDRKLQHWELFKN